MKKLRISKKNVLCGLFCLISLTVYVACSDVLDKKDLSAVSDMDVWNDAKYATAYLDKLCRDNLPAWDASVSNNSEESGYSSNILEGELTINSINTWNYGQIYNINILLAKVGSGSIDPETQAMLKAQALVLRAWRYFQMVLQYGGVPMIMELQDITDDLYVTRNKTSECIRLIVNDLDEAAGILPWTWTGNDAGRITKAAAIAFKARILLYWASPQFNPNNLSDRWTEAYTVNKYAKEELEKNGYGLYESFSNLWFNEMNKEVVFGQRYEYPGRIHDWDAGSRPFEPGTGASTHHRPTWDMVTAFPMKDGISISESPEYDSVYYWLNRDPRFAATIAYNGCYWGLPSQVDGRCWTFTGAELSGPTPTGFYCRKAINTTYTAFDVYRSSLDKIEIRYAEVMINYAECAAETGRLAEAYEILKLIRKRAGILAGDNDMYGLKTGMSQEEMIQAIMLERKIEFAFEGRRYWDLRRRRLFDSELNGTTRKRIRTTLLVPRTDFDREKDQVDWDKDYDKYFKDEIEDVQRIINFRDNYYFYAIPTSHLERNSKLEQTKGWENGTFDPLE
jgi:hypothetical protein